MNKWNITHWHNDCSTVFLNTLLGNGPSLEMDRVKLRKPKQKKPSRLLMIAIYKNLGGNSGVRAYEIMPTSIRVQFKEGKWYVYSYSKAGFSHVENMKILAERGIGLCSYIQRNVKYLYD